MRRSLGKWAAVVVASLALAAAGCSTGGKGQVQQGGGAPSAETKGSAGGYGQGATEMGKGGMDMGKGGMGMDMGGMGGMMGEKGGEMGMQGEMHGEGEYTPPTPEQLAKVTKTVTITLTEFAFDPKDVTVKKGDVVKFVVKNAGKLPHDWMAEGIKGLETGEFPGGAERVLVWTADRAGTFTTYCMVPGHKEAGMVGTLKVTD